MDDLTRAEGGDLKREILMSKVHLAPDGLSPRDVDKIKTAIDNDRRLTKREISQAPNITAIIASRHLRQFGIIWKLDT